MNDPVTAVVTTKDGVQFAVDTQRIAVSNEQRYALSLTADELEKNTDFRRLKSLDELVADDITAAEVAGKAAKAAARAKVKASLSVIKGGKKSPKIFGEV